MSRIPPTPAGEPEYSIFSASTMEPLNTLELHVLARAYRAAWRSIHASDPVNGHVIRSLGILIVFRGAPGPGPGPLPIQD